MVRPLRKSNTAALATSTNNRKPQSRRATRLVDSTRLRRTHDSRNAFSVACPSIALTESLCDHRIIDRSQVTRGFSTPSMKRVAANSKHIETVPEK
jgi:hypothetical protein